MYVFVYQFISRDKVFENINSNMHNSNMHNSIIEE